MEMSLLLSKYKKKPPKCGCEGCVFDALQDCPVSAGPKPSEWPCIVDDCIYVEEDEGE